MVTSWAHAQGNPGEDPATKTPSGDVEGVFTPPSGLPADGAPVVAVDTQPEVTTGTQPPPAELAVPVGKDDGKAPALPGPPGPDATVKERQAYWDTAPLGDAVPPQGLERKPPLSNRDRRNKRTQKPFAIIGVPQLGGNPDFGFIVGAVTALTWYGDPNKEPFFDYSPYRRQLIAQAQVGIRKKPGVLGRQNYVLRYQAPYIARSLFSYVMDMSFLADVSAQYFGGDKRTMGKLSAIGPDDPTFARSFGSFNEYQDQLREVFEQNGEAVTYATYHNYKLRTPRLLNQLKVDLFGGIVTPSATLQLAYVNIDRYGGERVRGTDGTGRSLSTKLDEDCRAGLAKHCNGAWNNTIKLSIAFDTRDFPVDANRGVLVDASFETAKKFLGSPDYNRFTLTAAGFLNPFLVAGIDNRYSQLVLAGRALYSVMSGDDIPFYAKNQLSFIDRTVGGLGGIDTMRGYRLNRFVGEVMVLGNFELRYDVYSFNTKRSTIAFKIVPFLDAGRVFDKVSQTSLAGYRFDGGSGLHLQWNQTNVIRADVGFGDEGASFGVNYGMLF